MNTLKVTKRQNVETSINYARPTTQVALMDDANKENVRIDLIAQNVTIFDARPEMENFKLERNAFQYASLDSKLKNVLDTQEIHSVYYREIADLVRGVTGAEHVSVFGEAVRSGKPGVYEGSRTPVFNAHVDYDRNTAQHIAQKMAPEDRADRYLKGRWMIINIWRPLKTVYRNPLAIADGSTMSLDDLQLCLLTASVSGVTPAYGLNICSNPKHRWYYLSEMQPNELLLFKMVDSDPEAVQWGAHTSFEIPNTPAEAPPRESIEVRCVAYFG